MENIELHENIIKQVNAIVNSHENRLRAWEKEVVVNIQRGMLPALQSVTPPKIFGFICSIFEGISLGITFFVLFKLFH